MEPAGVKAPTGTTGTGIVEFLDTVDAVNSSTPWVAKLHNREVEFKVDTSADVSVTVLPEEYY